MTSSSTGSGISYGPTQDVAGTNKKPSQQTIAEFRYSFIPRNRTVLLECFLVPSSRLLRSTSGDKSTYSTQWMKEMQ